MKLLIIGFNARPLAKSAKKAGYELGIIDYFGDLDLLEITRNCFSVLRQKPGETLHRPLHRTPAEYLYHLAEIMIDEQNDFDGILVGSSFDKYPEIIKKLQNLGPTLFANPSEKFTFVRDTKQIQKIALDAGFKIPLTIKVDSINELLEEVKNSSFPLVTRSGGGGGGAGIRFWNNYEELQAFSSKLDGEEIEKEYLIQEFVSGNDASASVICSKNTIHIISINQQIIGDNNFNAPGRFAYCGNIVPLKINKFTTDKQLIENLFIAVQNVFKKTKLLGSNGIDFVIKGNDVYFMEINPRFQGSIECVEYATGVNIVKNHIHAFLNQEISLPLYPKIRRSAIKGILFSNLEKSFRIKKYPSSKNIVDRTHYDVYIENGDPICSIVRPIRDQIRGYFDIVKLARKIIELNRE